MDSRELLALYDRERRIEIVIAGRKREAWPHLVREVDLTGHRGCVLYSRLNADTADGVIREQIEHYRALDQPFEWKFHSHDTPADLKERLIAAGFAPEAEESIMVLDLDFAPAALLAPVTCDVRQSNDLAALDDVFAVQRQITTELLDWLRAWLENILREAPETLTLHIAYHEGRPVASSWIDFAPGSQFAGLWGGSTLSEFRRRGFYRALLASRLQEAQARGRRFLTIDAGPMSRPIVERNGFQFLTTVQAFQWRPGGEMMQC